MARITVLPESEAIGTVDALELLKGRPAPEWDAEKGHPSQLRTFVVSQDPRIVVVPHFLSEAECRHVMELAEGLYTRSLVGSLVNEADEGTDGDTYARGIKSRQAQTRTSSSCMLRPAQTTTLDRVELRLANLARLPVEQLERPTAVRYAPGEHFSEHHDGKFRPRTVFVYLNDMPEGASGGDTFFPHLGLSFIPRAGAAVMWTNPSPDGVEDSRLVHCGRAPKGWVKHGINAFFNDDCMRMVQTPEVETPLQDAHVVDLAELGDGSGASGSGAAIRRYVLKSVPEITAIPAVATDEEVDHVLRLAAPQVDSKPQGEGDTLLSGGTRLLRLLQVAETPMVEALEQRLADAAQFSLSHLGPMRVVQSGSVLGACNRGSGQRVGLVCLSERDEVLFPHLGLRLKLRRGDALVWPNAWFSQPVDSQPGSRERVVEDLRTRRLHVGDERALALDLSFHDTPIRIQQREAPAGLSLSGG